MGLQWCSLDKGRCRNGREQCCEERLEVVGIRLFAIVRHRRGRPAGDGAGVNDRKIDLGVIGIQVEKQLVDLIDDFFDARVIAVHLVDDQNHRQTLGQGLAQHEPRLGKRTFGCIHKQHHTVDHFQATLDFATEVRVPGRIDDVEDHATIGS